MFSSASNRALVLLAMATFVCTRYFFRRQEFRTPFDGGIRGVLELIPGWARLTG